MELVGPDCSARQASGTRGLLLGFQVLLNLFKFFSQVWHFIVLSQIHSNHVAQSKSKLKEQNRRVTLQAKPTRSLQLCQTHGLHLPKKCTAGDCPGPQCRTASNREVTSFFYETITYIYTMHQHQDRITVALSKFERSGSQCSDFVTITRYCLLQVLLLLYTADKKRYSLANTHGSWAWWLTFAISIQRQGHSWPGEAILIYTESPSYPAKISSPQNKTSSQNNNNKIPFESKKLRK